MLGIEPEALPHLSFLGFVLPVVVGPEHPAYEINSNCLSAQQQYFQKRILFPVVPVGKTLGNEFSHGQSLKAAWVFTEQKKKKNRTQGANDFPFTDSLSLATDLCTLWEHGCSVFCSSTPSWVSFPCSAPWKVSEEMVLLSSPKPWGVRGVRSSRCAARGLIHQQPLPQPNLWTLLPITFLLIPSLMTFL